jgi:hypothetical protein
MIYHDLNQLFEGGLAGVPAQGVLGFSRITQKLINLCRTEIFGIYLYEGFAL